MKNQIIGTLVSQYVLGALYLVASGLWDTTFVPSALVGCLAALLPKSYFSIRMLRATEDYDAAQWLGYVYRSAIGKWVIMLAVMLIAFTSEQTWDPIVFFTGFVLIQMSGWIAPLVTKGN